MIAHAPSDSSPAPAAPAPLRAVRNRGGYDYLLSLPSDYAADPSLRWPLLICLHGTPPRGEDVWAVTQQGIPRLLAGASDLTSDEIAAGARVAQSFAVVAPQCPQHEVWDDATVLALLDDVGSELNVDAARVYLTGLSMGAFGAWSVAMRYPQRFAALVPICGGGRVADVKSLGRDRQAALRGLGVWAFHGALDGVVPVEESERMIEALRRAGVGDAQLTIYPDVQHDAWSRTYANPEVYAWLLRHER